MNAYDMFKFTKGKIIANSPLIQSETTVVQNRHIVTQHNNLKILKIIYIRKTMLLRLLLLAIKCSWLSIKKLHRGIIHVKTFKCYETYKNLSAVKFRERHDVRGLWRIKWDSKCFWVVNPASQNSQTKGRSCAWHNMC